ncbi:MarR family winged helix-turn-helix transcriptional regulator [Stackebrandtia soli]|uniref:MarR family winged helix-turn-helix transcriptional regulator n=1 Tax=Stackebrandtia soli TaxID=1892856 RepID=UPI0039E93922
MTRRESDDTDRLVEQWHAVVPDIDPKVERVVDRVLISARYLDRLASDLAAKHSLQRPDYEILARLFWVGPPHRLRPSQLAAGTMTAATTVTSRLDRLQKRGLITRAADPDDRRSMTAQLTHEGHTLFQRIVSEQATIEREIFEGLSAAQLDTLARLLNRTMTLLEDRLGAAPRRVTLALSGE